MPPRKPVKESKVVEGPQLLPEEKVDDKIDCISNYNVKKNHFPSIQNLEQLLRNRSYITPSKDEKTNLIDRINRRTYSIPVSVAEQVYVCIDNCRRKGIVLMFAERLVDKSCMFLDFDIYQDIEETQITEDTVQELCRNVAVVLKKYVNFDIPERQSVDVYFAVLQRSVVKFDTDRNCYKDGLHVNVFIKISKALKRFIVNKLKTTLVLNQALRDVRPTRNRIEKYQEYCHKDFLDDNSPNVPPFLYGSTSKPEKDPYVLKNIMMVKIYAEDDRQPYVKDATNTFVKDNSVNLCLELSLIWEGKLIKKRPYECHQSILTEVDDFNKKNIPHDYIKNYSDTSLLSIHDAQAKEIREVLDILSPERSINFKLWYDVLGILASISKTYKCHAEYFSRKVKTSWSAEGFEKYWQQAISEIRVNPRGIGTLYYLAEKDNPERCKELKKDTVFNMIFTLVYDQIVEGDLRHAHYANILHKLLANKYVTDIECGKPVWFEFMLDQDDDAMPGEAFKWYRHQVEPKSLSEYISAILPNTMKKILITLRKNEADADNDTIKYHSRIAENFRRSVNKLNDCGTKNNIIKEVATKFRKKGFLLALDANPYIRGYKNGILELPRGGLGPRLITGYHTHLVSKFTDVNYIPFDPRDPLTKDMLLILRGIFPGNEKDTFRFIMTYLSSTLDSSPKESIFLVIRGGGANGKTFLIELHCSVLGPHYAAKLPLSYLTVKSGSADNATPAQALLQNLTLARYSESESGEELNVSKIKEITGQETLAGRQLFKEMINFKPKCHHLVTTNYDFVIKDVDWGIWRRIKICVFKMTYIAEDKLSEFDEKNRYHNKARPEVATNWPSDPEIQGRYLGFMVYMYMLFQINHRGMLLRVPHDNIALDTLEYRKTQDKMTVFIMKKLVRTRDPTQFTAIENESKKYMEWYKNLFPNSRITIDQVNNMLIEHKYTKDHIRQSRTVTNIQGIRFLDPLEPGPAEGETYVCEHKEDASNENKNHWQTQEEFYEEFLKEYDTYKGLIHNDADYDSQLEHEIEINSHLNIGNPDTPSRVEIKNNLENKDELEYLIRLKGSAAAAHDPRPERKTPAASGAKQSGNLSGNLSGSRSGSKPSSQPVIVDEASDEEELPHIDKKNSNPVDEVESEEEYNEDSD